MLIKAANSFGKIRGSEIALFKQTDDPVHFHTNLGTDCNGNNLLSGQKAIDIDIDDDNETGGNLAFGER
jgi:hypothetical protein